MRILIDVYLPGLQNIRTDVPELGAWDTLGVSEELDYSLKQFPKTAFVSAKSTAGRYGISINGAYSWRVRIAPTTETAQLNIAVFPTILFFDLDTQKYVAKLEGTPQVRGIVAQLLRGVFASSPSVPQSTATSAALWFLALLLIAKINKA